MYRKLPSLQCCYIYICISSHVFTTWVKSLIVLIRGQYTPTTIFFILNFFHDIHIIHNHFPHYTIGTTTTSAINSDKYSNSTNAATGAQIFPHYNFTSLLPQLESIKVRTSHKIAVQYILKEFYINERTYGKHPKTLVFDGLRSLYWLWWDKYIYKSWKINQYLLIPRYK